MNIIRRFTARQKSPEEIARDQVESRKNELVDVQAKHAEAARTHLPRNERLLRAVALNAGRHALAGANDDLKQLQSRPDEANKHDRLVQAREERKETLAFAYRAAQLLGQVPENKRKRFDVEADKAVLYTYKKAPKPEDSEWVVLSPSADAKSIKGWMLFERAHFERVRDYEGGPGRIKDRYLYRGVFLAEDGRLMGFYGLELPLQPGARKDLVNAHPDGNVALKIASYASYREGFAADIKDPLNEEYRVQQQVADLLAESGIDHL